MMVLGYALPSIIATFLSYILWRLFKFVVVKSPISHIRGPPRSSWWKGNFYKIFARDAFQYHLELSRTYGSVAKLYTLWGQEELYTCDPRAMHHIVVKDQYVYEKPEHLIANNTVILGRGLLSTKGDYHKKQRKMMNPVFSLKHMRSLLPIFYPIAHDLTAVISRKIDRGEEEMNLLTWITRAALEYIGQGGLGYSFDALDESKNNTYAESVRLLLPLIFDLRFWGQILPYVYEVGSARFRRAVVEALPSRRVQKMKQMIDIMEATSVDILKQKKEAIAQGDEKVLNQVGQGQDIMSILLRANAIADAADRLPEEEVLGQMTTFIFAGYETTSGVICRVLHLLALNPQVQEKLRVEVSRAYREHGDMAYDTLMALPYLDAVCRETFRVYPPVPFVKRIATKDMTLPLMFPTTSVDGHTLHEAPVPRGTEVMVSIVAANHHKAIWGEDADEWKPERWLGPLPESVAAAHLPAVYSNLMTFIGGSRSCIGFKFSEMELKVMVSVLVDNFAFSVSKEILWNMGGMMSPVVKGGDGVRPEFPLKVRKVK